MKYEEFKMRIETAIRCAIPAQNEIIEIVREFENGQEEGQLRTDIKMLIDRAKFSTLLIREEIENYENNRGKYRNV